MKRPERSRLPPYVFYLSIKLKIKEHFNILVNMANYLRIENAEGYVLIAVYLYVCVPV